jgi:hypothetical protein
MVVKRDRTGDCATCGKLADQRAFASLARSEQQDDPCIPQSLLDESERMTINGVSHVYSIRADLESTVRRSGKLVA